MSYQPGEFDAYGNPVRHQTGLGQTDAYGNPVHGQTGLGQTDAYGNPVQHGGVHEQQQGHGHGVTGMLHRSGSSSSSSSEDDGQGGRRKKGIKQKLKEKLPGGHKEQQPGSGYAGQQPHTTPGGGYEETGEKKGIMEKIKEKFPGSHPK